MRKYLYCILRKPRAFQLKLNGLDRKKVYLLSEKNLTAAISDIESENIPLTAENAFCHEKVIREIMTEYAPLIPISFGVTAGSEKEIREKVLRKKEKELKEMLQKMENKIQINVRANWMDIVDATRKISRKYPELLPYQRKIKENKLDWKQKIDLGKFIKDKIEERKNEIKKLFIAEGRKIILDYTENPLSEDAIIFNLSILVDQKSEKNIEKIIRNMDKKLEEDRINFSYSEPLPPYNFTYLKLSI